jgi:hypothetical protein
MEFPFSDVANVNWLVILVCIVEVALVVIVMYVGKSTHNNCYNG